MKSVQKIDLGLTGYDELFMNDAERKENKLPRIYDIPLSEIDDFPDHPFKVKLDEDMDQLVQSIKERGIITPVTLRPKEDGRYADATPSLAQAIKLKRFSQDGKLNNEVIESIMSEEKPNQREKINIKYAEARRFIPASVPYEKTGEYTLITTTPPGMWTETETSGAMTPTMTARTTISIGCIRTMFPRHRKTGSKKKSTTAQPPEQISSVSPADLAMRSGRCTAGAFLPDRENEVRHDEPSTAERKLYCQAGLFGFQRKSLQQR